MKTISTLTILLISTICSAEINLSSLQNINTKMNGALMTQKSPVLAVAPKTWDPKTQSEYSHRKSYGNPNVLEIEIKTDNSKDNDPTGVKFVKGTLGMAGFGAAIGTIAFMRSDNPWKVKPLLKYSGYGALVGAILGVSCSAMNL